MISYIKKYWNEKPLTLIVFIAIFVRMFSVIFSKGFGMHDDHFLVVEIAKAWADGVDSNNWLPGTIENTGPSGHSFFYTGLHYILFCILKFIGITDPQNLMFFVRLIHAIFSLIVVICGYKIAERIHNINSAKTVGILLATLWFMPFLSVRTLVEVACIPFLMISTWMIIKDDKNKWYYLIAGISAGLAMSIRYQSFLFVFGIFLAIFINKRWIESIIFGLFVVISFSLTQIIVDMKLWGYPFAEFLTYVQYNIDNAYNYLTNSWYSYILLILGIIIPPIGFFIFFGFFRMWRKHLILFLPAFIFLAFHSYFPNKQERFILPIIPFVITLGIVGWNQFKDKSNFWMKRKKLLKGFWIFFWALNIILLPIISTMYSKKARVESMIYLSKYKNIKLILTEDSNSENFLMPPLFYLNQWLSTTALTKANYSEKAKYSIDSKDNCPRFVLFFDEKNLTKRVDSLRFCFPQITYETTIHPSFVDEILFKLNHRNTNQTIIIYKI